MNRPLDVDPAAAGPACYHVPIGFVVVVWGAQFMDSIETGEPEGTPTALLGAELDVAVDQYRKMRPRLEDFRLAFLALVRSLLADKGIRPQHVESRCKSEQGFREKTIEKPYHDPFVQMTDLVGVRVILYYQDQVIKAAGLFEHEFAVDEQNSSRQRMPKSSSAFGYRSYHLVVSLDTRRAALPEWREHASQKVEIQIRSVLDHAWAEVEHELFYERKKKGITPEPALSRTFSGLMATLEGVDDGFVRVRDLIEEATVAHEQGGVPMDDSVEAS